MERTMKKALAGCVLAGAMFAGMTGAASATHSHFVIRVDQDGVRHCRYIAEGQTSKELGEPGGHVFHLKVHTGQPGLDTHGTDFDRDINEAARCDTVTYSGKA
jgi:hypothetical protein